MSTTEARLAAAAFGADPGAWPLPTATTVRQQWLRAVAAGGQGRYDSARADLAQLLREASAGPLASLAHSTGGSLLRQLGWHARARGFDGHALVLAGADSEANADALIGLAADALGVGRFAASATLLASADRLPLSAPRLLVRRAWVGAELAMATGGGAAAVRHARQAVELAGTAPGPAIRHQVKSAVVLAAALCSAGDVDAARTVADTALDTTDRLGLVPLRWAAACLLVDLGSVAYPAAEVCRIRDECARQVRDRGGAWRGS